MTIKNALIWWNDWWADKPVDTGVLRENYILQISELLDTREIIVLEGVRRSGKSTIMHQIINKLLTKTSKNNICYVNLDDQRFGNDLEKIFDTYLELSSPDKKIYFFIDEIQNIEFWEKWIKSKYDKNRNIKFIISGSTTTLLSKEYSYLLSGRYFRIMVMP
ncbi:MAG: AAA family ATPase, partial [Candidatus Aenigmarchaeota archaeon]|nr:AAA family ATPase [Candidatus Aenigmarchaeota archaeon]